MPNGGGLRPQHTLACILDAQRISRRATGISPMTTTLPRRLASLFCAASMWPCAAAVITPTPLVEDVPFITTPDHVTVAMLELADVGAKDHVIDLGSGDGRIVITAAKRFGASGLGVEIVPELVTQSRDNARRVGVGERTRFEVQDLFATDLAPATVVTMYLLPEVNLALRPRLMALAPGTRIVSHDWDLGDWKPDRTLTLAVPQKSIGLEKTSRLHLWTVPARVDGLWCAPGGASLRIEQRYQVLQATLTQGTESHSFNGRVHGRQLQLLGAAGDSVSALADGELLRTTETTATGLRAGRAWRLAAGGGCG